MVLITMKVTVAKVFITIATLRFANEAPAMPAPSLDARVDEIALSRSLIPC